MAQAYMDTGLVHLSFNRYMVECEFSQRKGLPAWTRTVLIDTWWNVNYGKR